MNHKQFSAKGGKSGRGASKARTSEQASAAAQARWSLAAENKRLNDEVDRLSVGLKNWAPPEVYEAYKTGKLQ